MAALSKQTQDTALELIGAGRADEAVAVLEQSLAETPDSQPGWAMLMSIRYAQDRLAAWGDAVARLIDRIEDPEHTLLPLVSDMLLRGFGDEAARVAEAMLGQWPDSLAINEFVLFYKLTYGWDDAEAFAGYKRWNALVKRIRPAPPSAPAETDRTPDRPLRIGYLSNDFGGSHSLVAVLASWFAWEGENSDVHVLYSNMDPATEPYPVFIAAADAFQNVSALSDVELSDRIRADRIDILVDFIVHLPGNRLGALAMKPAPIIAAWLGVGIAPGEDSVDYVIGDEIAVSPAQRDNYVEKVVWLPEVYRAWQPPPRSPEIAPPPCLANGQVAFGNLNRIVKFSPECLDVWAEVLSQVPGSTMTFKYTAIDQEQSKAYLAAPFLAKGVGLERLIFLGATPQFEHLETYNAIDIVLDSFPQQSGVSGFEPPWMGVPTISYCCIDRPVGRFALMFAKWLDHDALVAQSPDDYVGIAIRLAADTDYLAEQRSVMRQRLLDSPLCNKAAYSQNVRLALREMWRRHCAGEPPSHFAVPGRAGMS